MPLIVFDVDGTLTQTTGVDDDCFVRAIRKVLGVDGFSTDWAEYPHATDSGLTNGISLRTRGRPATTAEHAAMHREFIGLLNQTLASHPDRFMAVPGAAELLRRIEGEAGWSAALATGAWKASAELKLGAARIGIDGLPFATADDAESRHDIARISIARAMGNGAQSHARLIDEAHERFGGVVYVGDGAWDARTSRDLGLGFVGVRVRGDEAGLRDAGARRVVRDFADADRIWAHLNDAATVEGRRWS
ncbi:MAG: HAD family hydrolase [Phycisphaerales bacterium]